MAPAKLPDWNFEKEMLAAESATVDSDPESMEFYDAEEPLRISSNMADLKKALLNESAASVLSDQYLSSEEELSPHEQELDSPSSSSGVDDVEESDYNDLEEASIYEAEMVEPFKLKFKCDLAVAVCILAAGPAKVIDVPIPSSCSSSIAGSVERPSRTSSLQYSIGAPSPRLSEKLRPALRSPVSDTNVAQISSPTSFPSSIESAPKPQIPRSIPLLTAHSYIPVEAKYGFTPSFLSTDPYDLEVTDSSGSFKSHHSRLRSLSQKISRFSLGSVIRPAEELLPIRRMALPYRRDSVHSARASKLSVLDPEAPSTPTLKSKMVPRGAAERAAPIEIPPFPDEPDAKGPPPAIPPRRRSIMLRRTSFASLGVIG